MLVYNSILVLELANLWCREELPITSCRLWMASMVLHFSERSADASGPFWKASLGPFWADSNESGKHQNNQRANIVALPS